MLNMLEKRFGRGPVALALPLAGLVGLWLFVIIAQVSDLYLTYGTYFDNYNAQQNAFHPSTYLFLVGLALLGWASVASRSRTHQLTSNRLERAIRGFTLVAVIASLIICTIFGFGQFMSNFMRVSYGSNAQPPSELMRVVNVYVPIVLDAALMVYLILRAFVHKVEESND